MTSLSMYTADTYSIVFHDPATVTNVTSFLLSQKVWHAVHPIEIELDGGVYEYEVVVRRDESGHLKSVYTDPLNHMTPGFVPGLLRFLSAQNRRQCTITFALAIEAEISYKIVVFYGGELVGSLPIWKDNTPEMIEDGLKDFSDEIGRKILTMEKSVTAADYREAKVQFKTIRAEINDPEGDE